MLTVMERHLQIMQSVGSLLHRLCEVLCRISLLEFKKKTKKVLRDGIPRPAHICSQGCDALRHLEPHPDAKVTFHVCRSAGSFFIGTCWRRAKTCSPHVLLYQRSEVFWLSQSEDPSPACLGKTLELELHRCTCLFTCMGVC